MGTMTAVGSPLSLETIWISVFVTPLFYYPGAGAFRAASDTPGRKLLRQLRSEELFQGQMFKSG